VKQVHSVAMTCNEFVCNLAGLLPKTGTVCCVSWKQVCL